MSLSLPLLLLLCCLSVSLSPTAADTGIHQQPRQNDRDGRILLQEMLSAGSNFQEEKEQEYSNIGARRLEPESFSPDSIWYGHSPEIARIVPYSRLQEQNQKRHKDFPKQKINEDDGLTNVKLKVDKIEHSSQVGEMDSYKKSRITPSKVKKHLHTEPLIDGTPSKVKKHLHAEPLIDGTPSKVKEHLHTEPLIDGTPSKVRKHLQAEPLIDGTPSKVKEHLHAESFIDGSLQQRAKNLHQNTSKEEPRISDSLQEDESAGNNLQTQMFDTDSNWIDQEPFVYNNSRRKHNIADLILQHIESSADNSLHQQQTSVDTSLQHGEEHNGDGITQEIEATSNSNPTQQKIIYDSSWQQQQEKSSANFLHQQESDRKSSFRRQEQQQQQQQQQEEMNTGSNLKQKDLPPNSSIDQKGLNTDSSSNQKDLITDSSLPPQNTSTDSSWQQQDLRTDSGLQQQDLRTDSRLQQQGLSTDSSLQQQEPKHGAESSVTARVSALLRSVVVTASKQVRLSQAVVWVGLTAVLVGLCVTLFGSMAAHHSTGGQDREHLDYGGSPLIKDPYRTGLAMADREDIGDVIKRIRQQRREMSRAPARY